MEDHLPFCLVAIVCAITILPQIGRFVLLFLTFYLFFLYYVKSIHADLHVLGKLKPSVAAAPEAVKSLYAERADCAFSRMKHTAPTLPASCHAAGISIRENAAVRV